MKRTGTIISAALLHLTLLPHKEVGMRAEAVDAACSLSACFCVPGRKLLLGAGGGGDGVGHKRAYEIWDEIQLLACARGASGSSHIQRDRLGHWRGRGTMWAVGLISCEKFLPLYWGTSWKWGSIEHSVDYYRYNEFWQMLHHFRHWINTIWVATWHKLFLQSR